MSKINNVGQSKRFHRGNSPAVADPVGPRCCKAIEHTKISIRLTNRYSQKLIAKRTVIVEQFLDQIDVSQYHASTAVSCQL